MEQLTQSDTQRYSRHLALPGFTESHQRALVRSRILVIGAGGLGSPALLYLAAAGFGHIGIVDDDDVDLSNLQRQIIHRESDVGTLKVESAADKIRSLNCATRIDCMPFRLTSENALKIIKDFDIVIDGSDNLPTRYLVNDACVLTGRPLVYGSVFRYEGQVSVFGYDGGPCYRCLFPKPPPPDLVPSCEAAGVLGVVPGIVGTYQAAEAIKIATGIGTPLSGKLLLIDTLSNDSRHLSIARSADCPVCGTSPTITELIEYEIFCGLTTVPTIAATDVQQLLSSKARRVRLVDVREQNEREAGNIGGLHIPIAQLRRRLAEVTDLANADLVVVYCRSGKRSATAARILLEAGVDESFSLEGGMLEWKKTVDPDIHVL